MIVVDTNIIAYLYISGEQSLQAEQLLSYDSDWNAPALW
jgi:predicted nucleic acid-binding protein